MPIASCPCDDRNLHFHICRDAGDAFAQLLFDGALTAGERRQRCAGPAGDFVLAESERPLAFLACDTGFAPVKSLIEHAMAVDAAESLSLDWLAHAPRRPLSRQPVPRVGRGLRPVSATRRARDADPGDGRARLVAAMAAALPLAARDVYVAGPAAFVDGGRSALAPPACRPADPRAVA